jgi:hypothetical protein
MPIYKLDGSLTVRDTAPSETYGLEARGITCDSISSAAIAAIEASNKSKAFATDNGFSTSISLLSSQYGSSVNTCEIGFAYNDDMTYTTHNATISYKMATSKTDKTAVIDSISLDI